MNSSARAIKEGYSGGNSHFRSGLEESNADYLEGKGFLSPSYEEMTLYYLPEIVPKRYTPDFIFEKKDTDEFLIIETKGRFVTADRKKHKLIKEQYPHLDIRFVFSNSRTRISKASKTTYGMWCEKLGFPYADKFIPEEWLDECKQEIQGEIPKEMFKEHVQQLVTILREVQ